jgi:hypothetical protein
MQTTYAFSFSINAYKSLADTTAHACKGLIRRDSEGVCKHLPTSGVSILSMYEDYRFYHLWEIDAVRLHDLCAGR